MPLHRSKILPLPDNCNCPPDNTATERERRSQAALGIALSRANHLPGRLTHIGIPVRRILARLSSRLREGD